MLVSDTLYMTPPQAGIAPDQRHQALIHPDDGRKKSISIMRA